MGSLRSTAIALCPAMLRPMIERIEASPIATRLAHGVFWSMAGAVISRGLMLVATICVARLLGKAVYGELGMIQSTVGMFGVFAGFGLGLTSTKYVAEFREKDPDRVGRIIALASLVAAVTGGLMALGLVIFAPWLAEHTINAPHLAGVLRIGSLILFFSALNGAQTGALSGFEAFKAIAHVNLFIGLFSFPILFAGAYLGGLKGAVWAMAINMAINWLLNYVALRKQTRNYSVPLTFRHCGLELPVLWKFSLPAVLGGIMVGPVNWICGALLVNQPNGYGEMGIFSAANQWFTILMFLPGMLGSVVLPVLSDQLGRNNTAQSMKTLVFTIKANLFIVVPLAIAASIASPYIMHVYGDEFGGGWPTLIVVLMTAVLFAVNSPVGQILAASGRMWVGLTMNAGWAVVFILSTILLIDHGALGLASARGIAYLLHSLWVFVFAISLLRRIKDC